MFNRQTKILATIGPASESPKMMARLLKEGVDAFRLNLAHGTHEDHEQRVKFLRSDKAGRLVAIVADIRGSKVRVGSMPKEGVLLEKGRQVVIHTAKTQYENGLVPIQFPLRDTNVKRGSTVFIDDGTIILEVKKVAPPKIFCEVIREGRLFSRRGVNIPGAKLHPSGVADKDREDILFAKKLGADYVSLSFLANIKDIKHARSFLEGSHTKVIAKIESPQALENFDEILERVDAVMIARGDLGLEIPISEVPIRQKDIIEKCHKAGVPVIVATQMLASMMNTLLPTRAEVSDIANAVFDAVDCVMLSGETASGLYPVEAVRMMRTVVEAAEARSPRDLFYGGPESLPVNIAIAEAACEASRDIKAKFILIGTTSGFSAKAVAKYRPSVPIIAVTEHSYVAQQLSLVWGVRTLCFPEKRGVESSVNSAIELLKKEGALNPGDSIVYVSGIKFGKVGGTNMMRVLTI